MKFTKIRLVLIGLSMVLFNQVVGQTFEKGFVITQAGDTLNGFVKAAVRFSSKCEFSETFGGKSEVFEASDIKAFGFSNGTRFVSNLKTYDYLKATPMFLQLIVEGDVPLVYNGIYAIKKDNQWHELRNKFGIKTGKESGDDEVVTSEGKLYSKDNKEYIRILNAVLVNECFTLSTMVKKVSYTHKSLSKFLSEYYDCTNKRFESYLGKKKYEIGLLFGFTGLKDTGTPSILFPLDLTKGNANSNGYSFRLNLATRTKLANKRVKAELALEYSPEIDFLIEYEDVRSFVTDFYETRFSYSAFRADLSLKYYLPVGPRIELFAGGGIGLLSILQSSQSRIIEELDGGIITSQDGSGALEFKKSNVYYLQSVGLNYSLRPGKHAIFELFHTNGGSPMNSSLKAEKVWSRKLNIIGARLGYAMTF